MARLTAGEKLSIILILAVGAIGVVLAINIAVHLTNPSIILVPNSAMASIALLEFMGICFSMILSKGKPPLGFLAKRKR